VLALADRIAVMYRGKIAGEVPGGTPAEQIGLLMAGSSVEEANSGAALSSGAATGGVADPGLPTPAPDAGGPA
jgi:simple sugar transport system ATP-binding protein